MLPILFPSLNSFQNYCRFSLHRNFQLTVFRPVILGHQGISLGCGDKHLAQPSIGRNARTYHIQLLASLIVIIIYNNHKLLFPVKPGET